VCNRGGGFCWFPPPSSHYSQGKRMVAPLYTTASGLLFHAGKIVILTIGLPARGKTHISRALERYLRWMGIKTLVVSLGDYRRKILGGAQKVPPDYFSPGAFAFWLFLSSKLSLLRVLQFPSRLAGRLTDCDRREERRDDRATQESLGRL
jgi:6-phosphofructo-2-kinase